MLNLKEFVTWHFECGPLQDNSQLSYSFLGGSMVKNPPAMQETQAIQSLGQEDPLDEDVATHSGILT